MNRGGITSPIVIAVEEEVVVDRVVAAWGMVFESEYEIVGMIVIFPMLGTACTWYVNVYNDGDTLLIDDIVVEVEVEEGKYELISP